ncbi:SDR family NAD(P)-dependent oxidoreductase [Streptomyces exfoliatus]|uniref:SDR family NAD(P)-dependent oxidoreductase n=1 Tax=Streptomyces exfoliatus TaxID=1905 RepID=UPI003C2D6A61
MRTVRRHARPFEGRTVVVTGASAGVGRATARAFGASGARVALLARGRVGLEAAADEVERAGGTALVVPVDMAVPAQAEAAADQVESRLGPVDVWVNAAFTSRPVPPVYQPEVAARAVLHAARHPRRREYRVRPATTAAVLARRAAPGLLDRYLARTGYAAQQTDVASTAAPHNLWFRLDGAGGRDHGAHGSFDDEAAAHSPYTAHARHLAAAGAAVGTSAFVARALLGRPGAARRPRAEGR